MSAPTKAELGSMLREIADGIVRGITISPMDCARMLCEAAERIEELEREIARVIEEMA